MMSSRSREERSAPHFGIAFSRKILRLSSRCSSIHLGSFLSAEILRTTSSLTPFFAPFAYGAGFGVSKTCRLSLEKMATSCGDIDSSVASYYKMTLYIYQPPEDGEDLTTHPTDLYIKPVLRIFSEE